MTSAPVLKAPNFGLLFKLAVDVSGGGAGDVLQEDPDGVCYCSKKFIRHQCICPTMEKEALVFSLKHLGGGGSLVACGLFFVFFPPGGSLRLILITALWVFP